MNERRSKLCSIPGCRNKPTRSRTYHKIPKNVKHQSLWKKALPDVKLTVCSLVCSAHFQKSDFIKYKGKQQLAAGAIPSLLLTNDLPKETKKKKKKVNKPKKKDITNKQPSDTESENETSDPEIVAIDTMKETIIAPDSGEVFKITYVSNNEEGNEDITTEKNAVQTKIIKQEVDLDFEDTPFPISPIARPNVPVKITTQIAEPGMNEEPANTLMTNQGPVWKIMKPCKRKIFTVTSSTPKQCPTTSTIQTPDISNISAEISDTIVPCTPLLNNTATLSPMTSPIVKIPKTNNKSLSKKNAPKMAAKESSIPSNCKTKIGTAEQKNTTKCYKCSLCAVSFPKKYMLKRHEFIGIHKCTVEDKSQDIIVINSAEKRPNSTTITALLEDAMMPPNTGENEPIKTHKNELKSKADVSSNTDIMEPPIKLSKQIKANNLMQNKSVPPNRRITYSHKPMTQIDPFTSVLEDALLSPNSGQQQEPNKPQTNQLKSTADVSSKSDRMEPPIKLSKQIKANNSETETNLMQNKSILNCPITSVHKPVIRKLNDADMQIAGVKAIHDTSTLQISNVSTIKSLPNEVPVATSPQFELNSMDTSPSNDFQIIDASTLESWLNDDNEHSDKSFEVPSTKENQNYDKKSAAIVDTATTTTLINEPETIRSSSDIKISSVTSLRPPSVIGKNLKIIKIQTHKKSANGKIVKISVPPSAFSQIANGKKIKILPQPSKQFKLSPEFLQRISENTRLKITNVTAAAHEEFNSTKTMLNKGGPIAINRNLDGANLSKKIKPIQQLTLQEDNSAEALAAKKSATTITLWKDTIVSPQSVPMSDTYFRESKSLALKKFVLLNQINKEIIREKSAPTSLETIVLSEDETDPIDEIANENTRSQSTSSSNQNKNMLNNNKTKTDQTSIAATATSLSTSNSLPNVRFIRRINKDGRCVLVKQVLKSVPKVQTSHAVKTPLTETLAQSKNTPMVPTPVMLEKSTQPLLAESQKSQNSTSLPIIRKVITNIPRLPSSKPPMNLTTDKQQPKEYKTVEEALHAVSSQIAINKVQMNVVQPALSDPMKTLRKEVYTTLKKSSVQKNAAAQSPATSSKVASLLSKISEKKTQNTKKLNSSESKKNTATLDDATKETESESKKSKDKIENDDNHESNSVKIVSIDHILGRVPPAAAAERKIQQKVFVVDAARKPIKPESAKTSQVQNDNVSSSTIIIDDDDDDDDDDIAMQDNLIEPAIYIGPPPSSTKGGADSVDPLNIDAAAPPSIIVETKCQICCQSVQDIAQHNISLKHYKCVVCGEYMRSFEELKNHMQTVCKNNRFVCNKCKLIFSSENLMKIHLKKCRNIEPMMDNVKSSTNQCIECNIKFSTTIQFEEHNMSKHKLHKLNCRKCNVNFTNKFEYTEHMLKHEIKTKFKCEICTRPFVTAFQLKVHFAKHFSNSYIVSYDDVSNMYFCKICQYRHESFIPVKRHTAVAHIITDQ